jgi:hypothetical protein
MKYICVAQMSVSANRREAVAGAAAAAVVAPMLRPESAEARDKFLRAPVITMFDGRGCKDHLNLEYTGPRYHHMLVVWILVPCFCLEFFVRVFSICPSSKFPQSI